MNEIADCHVCNVTGGLIIPWDACGTPTVKIRFGCTQNCKASQYDCLKSLAIISSSKSTNGTVQNLYRFVIDLLALIAPKIAKPANRIA